MPRFFSPSEKISVNKIILADKEQVHHLKDVLRLKPQDKLTVFDEQGNEYTCRIDKITEKVSLVIQAQKKPQKNKMKITVACAIPKKSKFDEIVDKLTQLGVDKIIPLQTQRVVVKLEKNKKISRRIRWEKIALSAAQQSQRNTLPVIAPVQEMREALSQAGNYDLKLIPHLSGRRKTLREIFVKRKARNILIFIGPEGDFTPEEVRMAINAGCIPVTLGDTVLRVDTAAMAIVSFIRLYADY